MDQETYEYIQHHGVKGMRWGVRKKRPKGVSRSKKSTSIEKRINIKDRIKNVDKEKVKKVAKTSAKVLGRVAAASLLGYTGSVLYSNILSEINRHHPSPSFRDQNIAANIERIKSGNFPKNELDENFRFSYIYGVDTNHKQTYGDVKLTDIPKFNDSISRRYELETELLRKTLL